MYVGSSQSVRAWAVKQPGASWVLILLNKALTATQQDILMSSCTQNRTVNAAWLLNGTYYTDLKPVLSQVPSTTAKIANDVLSIVLPPVSITVLEISIVN